MVRENKTRRHVIGPEHPTQHLQLQDLKEELELRRDQQEGADTYLHCYTVEELVRIVELSDQARDLKIPLNLTYLEARRRVGLDKITGSA